MDGMGDDPFCPLFIDTMLSNKGSFFLKTLRVTKA